MTYFCVYNIASGNLVDVDVTPPNDIPEGCSIQVNSGDIPDRYFYTWNKIATTFEARIGAERNISVLQFLNRFTAIERITIKEAAKTNSALADYFEMLGVAQFIDLDDPTTNGGLSFLVYLGLLEQTRIMEILS